MSERTLNHYTFIRFKDPFWQLSAQERSQWQATWLADLHEAAQRVAIHQVFPARADADIVVWSALHVEAEETTAHFFRRFAQATNPHRQLLEPMLTLWGFTRPSVYARGQSSQEINPFSEDREPYLVIYPFVKTVDWYLMSRDARQGMMNEHIRIGHQYPAIKQLLLYSFGLQDQEFIVVYETADLLQFSDLVNELRSSEARRYTERDTPIFTAISQQAGESPAPWL